MVLVAREHRARAVEHRRLPLLVAVRQHALRRHVHAVLLPGTVRLEIRLIDDVDPVAVRELVEAGGIRVVRRTHGVDVVPLHRDDVALDRLGIDGAPAVAVKLVAVHTLEHDALAVELHEPAREAELAKADCLRHDLLHIACRVAHREERAVEMRQLRTPELHTRERER